MSKTISPTLVFVLTLFFLLVLIGCVKQAPAPAGGQAKQETGRASAVSSPDEVPAPSNSIILPLGFTRDPGDCLSTRTVISTALRWPLSIPVRLTALPEPARSKLGR
jgi:hypothetical protein